MPFLAILPMALTMNIGHRERGPAVGTGSIIVLPGMRVIRNAMR